LLQSIFALETFQKATIMLKLVKMNLISYACKGVFFFQKGSVQDQRIQDSKMANLITQHGFGKVFENTIGV
jgi:hypothetical protein